MLVSICTLYFLFYFVVTKFYSCSSDINKKRAPYICVEHDRSKKYYRPFKGALFIWGLFLSWSKWGINQSLLRRKYISNPVKKIQ